MDQIETFLDLCETRSFNRTADRLGITQSTVSGRVRALEQVLEVRLFTRSRAGTELTPEGLQFEPHARNLRLSWTEARNATTSAGLAAATLRIGVQHDLAGPQVSDLISSLRDDLPFTKLYVEADYSAQMCLDISLGALDAAIIYSPKPHPDLHFETLGEVSFQMVSCQGTQLAEISPETYVLANYSPAFSATHAMLLPRLANAPVASGQGTVIVGMMTAFGGAAYVTRDEARVLIASGQAKTVGDAPIITQSVYAVLHIRNRHRTAHRRLMRNLRSYFREPFRQERSRLRETALTRPLQSENGS